MNLLYEPLLEQRITRLQKKNDRLTHLNALLAFNHVVAFVVGCWWMFP